VTDHSVVIRVTAVLSRGRPGGAIVSGVTDTDQSLVAVCNQQLIPDSSLVDKGQLWFISGPIKIWGPRRRSQIEARSAELMRPSGKNIVAWITNSSMCPGIGRVKASRLYKKFGEDLVAHIMTRNICALIEVVTEHCADMLCHAFAESNLGPTLLWLDRMAIDRRIGQKVVHYYGDQAQRKIEENPYRLISFAENWKKIDNLAQTKLNIAVDDPRRLDAAVEEVLYAGMLDGHTCLPTNSVSSRLWNLLGQESLAKNALAMKEPSSQYVRIDDLLQASGPYLIERYLADRLSEIAADQETGQEPLFGGMSGDLSVVNDVITEYEMSHGFDLTAEQRTAVSVSANANLSLILGGAGTGKTTVLKALYQVLDATHPNISIYQIALAGRAAQRMSEATGRESKTIAGFLLSVEADHLGHGSVIVVDEMSMVDAILMYRLLRHIPPGTKLILVGDPSQLPPIGPGLVLHVLAGHPAIRQTELKVTKRQSTTSGIPSVAAAIRAHRVPSFAEYAGLGNGVSFVPCADAHIEAAVRRVYGDLGGDGADNSVQILSITKNGCGGVQNINTAFHNEFRRDGEVLYAHDATFGRVGAQTHDRIPLRVGDLVLYTENDYKLGLRNGSLGVVISALEATDRDADCCICEFDGLLYRLNSRQVDALRHAYAITIHKSQGSQFERVVIPIRKSRLLDQTLVYTAVTRGVEQVVLVGDFEAACNAIVAPPSAARRHVTLQRLLNG
jgi:exodeoxyribonuclease V alpha subunit